MADASRPPPSPPPAWGESFAALPQEAPETSRWPQIEAQLDARTIARPHAGARGIRRGWPSRARLAAAAGLCALAVLPFAWRTPDRSTELRAPATAAAPSTTPSTIDTATVAVVPHATVDAAPPPAPSAARVAIAATVATPPRTRNAGRRAAKIAVDTMPATTRAPADGETLESLYSASAQLETLLAMTRDTRVESGPAAVLAGGFDAELALIDARLAEPGLDLAEQRTLWRARVDTLQDASGFEAHQRLLSAEGRRYEGALVSVD